MTIAALASWLAVPGAATAKSTFDEHVKPIFREHCAGCHNQDDAASDLALDGFDAAIAGGAGGEALAAGDPDGSRLWRMVNHEEEPVMPPGSDKLPEDQLATIRKWIEEGMLKDAGSKPMASSKPAITAVDPGSLGKPRGEPAMPAGLFREPMLTSPVTGPIDSIAVSPWAPLAAIPWQRQVSLYHTETQALLGVIPYLDGVPRVVRFSRDGSLLLVAGGIEGASGTAALFDVKSGARLATVGDELDAVLAADVSPDNRLVAIGGPKKKVRVYRVADGSLAYTCEKHTDWITALAFSPDGKLLATADRSSGLRLWNAAAGHERADLRGHKQSITAIDWRRDGGLLASASEDGSVRLWNQEGQSIKSINAHGGGALAVAFDEAGRLATTGRDRRVRLWKPDGGHVGDMKPLDEIGLAIAFAPDGKHLIASAWSGRVSLFNLESKQPCGTFRPNPPTLASRLQQATDELSTFSNQTSAIEAKRNAASVALKAGRADRLVHSKKLEESRQSLAASIEDLEAKQAHAAVSEEKLRKAKQSLAEARKHFREAKKALAASSIRNEASQEESKINTLAEAAERLANAVDTTREARNAARAALAKVTKAHEQAVASRVASEKQKLSQEQSIASLMEQADSLPDIKALALEAKALEEAAGQAAAQQAAARTTHGKLKAEVADLADAVDRLAAEAEAAIKQRTEGDAELNRLVKEREQRQTKARTAREQKERLRATIDKLRSELKEAIEEHEAKASELASVDQRLRAQQELAAAAKQRAALAEAKLAGQRDAEVWRRSRQAEKQP